MKISYNDNGIWTIDRDTGTVDLTSNEVSLLVNQFMKHGLRESIEYACRELDGDTIDLNKLPEGLDFEDFVTEVFLALEDEVDYGNYPNDDDINEKIQDTAYYYDMECDD